MLKRTEKELQEMEDGYPGVIESIMELEEMELPRCTACQSENTATLQCGIVGRSIMVASGTSKIKLVPNRSKTGPLSMNFFCNDCKGFFDEPGEVSS